MCYEPSNCFSSKLFHFVAKRFIPILPTLPNGIKDTCSMDIVPGIESSVADPTDIGRCQSILIAVVYRLIPSILLQRVSASFHLTATRRTRRARVSAPAMQGASKHLPKLLHFAVPRLANLLPTHRPCCPLTRHKITPVLWLTFLPFMYIVKAQLPSSPLLNRRG